MRKSYNKDLFLKVLGGAVAGFGFWSWTAFLFAGTGFAMPIVIAIMAGGGALMAYSDKITEWLTDNYDCPTCKKNYWIEEGKYEELQAKEREKQKALRAKEEEKQRAIKIKEEEKERLKEELDYFVEEADKLENKLESKQIELENKIAEIMKKLEKVDK